MRRRQEGQREKDSLEDATSLALKMEDRAIAKRYTWPLEIRKRGETRFSFRASLLTPQF